MLLTVLAVIYGGVAGRALWRVMRVIWGIELRPVKKAKLLTLAIVVSMSWPIGLLLYMENLAVECFFFVAGRLERRGNKWRN